MQRPRRRRREKFPQNQLNPLALGQRPIVRGAVRPERRNRRESRERLITVRGGAHADIVTQAFRTGKKLQ